MSKPCAYTLSPTSLPLLEYSITRLCAYRLVLRSRVREPSSLLILLGIRCRTVLNSCASCPFSQTKIGCVEMLAVAFPTMLLPVVQESGDQGYWGTVLPSASMQSTLWPWCNEGNGGSRPCSIPCASQVIFHVSSGEMNFLWKVCKKMLCSEDVVLHSEWRLPLKTLTTTETVTKLAFQWNKKKGLIAEKAQEDQCSQLRRC